MKVGEFKKQLVTEVKRLLKEAVRINRDELVQKIKDTKGEFFTVTFIKKRWYNTYNECTFRC